MASNRWLGAWSCAVLAALLASCGGGTQAPSGAAQAPLAAGANEPAAPSTSTTPDGFFTWAESTYPEHFPSATPTQVWQDWQYRSYPATQNELGVYGPLEGNTAQVWARGPATGNKLTYIAPLADFTCRMSPISCGTLVNFETIAADTRIEARREVAVRTAADWATLWAEAHTHRVPAPALPPVDFSREMVVAVFLGARSSGCYGAVIRGIATTGSKLVVQWQETVPQPNMSCIAAFTYPSHIAKLPRSELPVEFYKMAWAGS